MSSLARRAVAAGFLILDLVATPLVAAAAILLRWVRRIGLRRLPASRATLSWVGLLPVRNHYYEPYFDAATLGPGPSTPRDLPGLDLKVPGQLAFLDTLADTSELADIDGVAFAGPRFSPGNRSFGPGDAEFLYLFLRTVRPRRIFEIGCGNSTRVALAAVARNRADDPAYRCEHVCVEPFEAPWLEQEDVRVVRAKVETLPRSFWRDLEPGDLLFIDSSHAIRPRGDVLYEYLELLPVLVPGVFVHIHDIFTPRDYPARWLVRDRRLWQEQYLVEAILTSSRDWEIIAALNHLHHEHPERLRAKCPSLRADSEPGSLYIRKVS